MSPAVSKPGPSQQRWSDFWFFCLVDHYKSCSLTHTTLFRSVHFIQMLVHWRWHRRNMGFSVLLTDPQTRGQSRPSIDHWSSDWQTTAPIPEPTIPKDLIKCSFPTLNQHRFFVLETLGLNIKMTLIWSCPFMQQHSFSSASRSSDWEETEVNINHVHVE